MWEFGVFQCSIEACCWWLCQSLFDVKIKTELGVGNSFSMLYNWISAVKHKVGEYWTLTSEEGEWFDTLQMG